jgi:hypothetical protein
MHRMRLLLLTCLCLALGLPLAGPATAADVRPPPVAAGLDYQLGGAYALPEGVGVVVRDRTEAPAPGTYSVCYVNGFQTQPGALRWWRRQHPDLLLRDDRGLVRDPGWRAEVLLDTSTPARRRSIARIVGRWIGGCADDGFHAVEPDNLDSFTRSRGLLRRADALALSRLLARRPHAEGLAIAQKNLAGVTRAERRRVGFDFAVAEECEVWRECGRYRRVYGRHVLEVEYTDNGRRAFARACRLRAGAWSIVLRDRDLVTPADPGYVRRSC